MAIAGAIVGVVSGLASAAQGLYQMQVANMNAEVAGENAKNASAAAAIEAQKNDWQTRAKVADQKVAQAGSGVSLSGRSQILTRRTTQLLGRADSYNIQHAGSIQRYNHLVEQANFKAQAKGAMIGAVGSLIGGVASAASAIPTSLVSGSSAVANPGRYSVKPLSKPTATLAPPAPKMIPFDIKGNPLLRPRLTYGGAR